MQKKPPVICFFLKDLLMYIYIIFLLSFLYMKHHIKKMQHLIKQRGYMIAFLMVALMVTSWIYTFGEAVNAAVISTYLG